MTRRLITLEVDDTIFVLRGYKAHGLALAAGLRPTYSGVRQGWVADTKRLPDLVGYLEYRNVAVEVTGVNNLAPAGNPTPAPSGAGVTNVPPVASATEVELDLFGDAS